MTLFYALSLGSVAKKHLPKIAKPFFVDIFIHFAYILALFPRFSVTFPRFSPLFLAIFSPISPGDHPRGHGRAAARGVGRALGERAEERLAPGAEAGARVPERGDLPGGWTFQEWCQVPSGYVKIAIENGHRNSGFSH